MSYSGWALPASRRKASTAATRDLLRRRAITWVGSGIGLLVLTAAARRVTLGNVLDVALLLIVVWAIVAKPAL